jgi:hypothetical protein
VMLADEAQVVHVGSATDALDHGSSSGSTSSSTDHRLPHAQCTS